MGLKVAIDLEMQISLFRVLTGWRKSITASEQSSASATVNSMRAVADFLAKEGTSIKQMKKFSMILFIHILLTNSILISCRLIRDVQLMFVVSLCTSNSLSNGSWFCFVLLKKKLKKNRTKYKILLIDIYLSLSHHLVLHYQL